MPPFDLNHYHTLNAAPSVGAASSVGATVRYREQTASTMDDARAGADAGADVGTAYVAGEQTAGRGRQRRTWLSQPGGGLAVTFHLRPAHTENAPLLSAAGALAAADAIRETSGVATDIKWPNDVLYEGRKLVGVLAEARHGAALDVFLGIGINVRDLRDPPEELLTTATSIEGAGGDPPDIEHLLAALSHSLQRWSDLLDADPTALIEEWRGRLITIGTRIRLATPSGVVEGEALDVSEHGELVLRLDDGTTQPFSAGDVTTAPPLSSGQ
jgi:BirA family biotin operon repressor/biotin-[acetyl-CoA-carboxylase] ligase